MSQECRAFVRSVELIPHQVVKGLFNFVSLAPQLELPLLYSWKMAHCFQHDNSTCIAGLQFSLDIVVKHIIMHMWCFGWLQFKVAKQTHKQCGECDWIVHE